MEKRKEFSNINLNDYKYKVIQKVINSNKELGEIFSKINNKNTGENFHESKHYENEDNINLYYNYNNRGKNKKGRKFYRGNNNKY